MAENIQDQENLSMEDILSSIKGILAENEKTNGEKPSVPETQETLPASKNEDDDVFNLSSSMIVDPSNTLHSGEPENAGETDIDLGLDDISLDSVKLPDVRDNSEIDIDAEPIYDPEEEISAQPDVDVGTGEINVGLPEIQEEALPVIEADNAAEISQPEDIAPEPEIRAQTSIADSSETDALPEIEEPLAEEKQVAEETASVPAEEPAAPAPKPEITVPDTPAKPVADVSEDIIDNFARMFYENKKTEPVPAATPETGLGNGNQTLEDLVKSVIAESLQPVVAKAASSVEADILSYARDEVKTQAKAWIDANLTRVVEEVVREEVRRVMAKVGS